MHALNQGRLPVDSVRGLVRSFNMGGLVQSTCTETSWQGAYGGELGLHSVE